MSTTIRQTPRPTKRPTRNQLEALHHFVGDLMKCDLGAQHDERFTQLGLTRALLASMVAEIIVAAPNPADHRPVEYDVMVLGCSCGVRGTRAKRASMLAKSYVAHLRSLNIDPFRSWSGGDVLIDHGEHKGKTYADVYPTLYCKSNPR